MDVYQSRPTSSKGIDDQVAISNSTSSLQSEAEVESSASEVLDDDDIFNTTLLGPVKFWGQSPKAPAPLQPGIELLNFDNDSDGDGSSSKSDKKGKQKQASRNPSVRFSVLLFSKLG